MKLLYLSSSGLTATAVSARIVSGLVVAIASLSLLLWGLVIISGRMIAYNWFDCDKQPQSELVNFLISCTVDPEIYEYLNGI